jgi:hypothetical protein
MKQGHNREGGDGSENAEDVFVHERIYQSSKAGNEAAKKGKAKHSCAIVVSSILR